MSSQQGFLIEPVGVTLLRMSLCNSIGVLAAASFALVDTYFVSLLGTQALTAINFTHPVTLLITSCALGLGTALSSALARHVGANHMQSAKLLLKHALYAGLILLSGISLFSFSFDQLLFSALGAQASWDDIQEYMHVWYIGVPCFTMMILLQQALRSLGDAKSSAMITCFAALLNVALDPLFIFGIGTWQGYGIAGAAYASLCAWSLSSLSLIIVLSRKHPLLDLSFLYEFNFSLFYQDWVHLSKLAKSASLTLLLNPITQSISLALLARLNPYAVAAYGTGLKIQSFCIIGVTALSASLTPFIAQNLGANQNQRAYYGLRQSVKWIFIWQILLFIPLHLYSHDIAYLFSRDQDVLEWLDFYLHWLSLGFAPLAIIILIANALLAYQKPMYSICINAFRLVGLTLPLTLIGIHFYGATGAFVAPMLANILVGLCCYGIVLWLSPSRNPSRS